MTENNYLTQTQLTERWQVAESTLERWRSEGIGPIYMKMMGRVRYRLAAPLTPQLVQDQILPLVRLDHVLHGDGGHPGLSTLQVVVCRQGEQRAGVVVSAIHDIVETALDTRTPLDSTGGDGSAVVSGHVTELVDIAQVFAGLPADRLAWSA